MKRIKNLTLAALVVSLAMFAAPPKAKALDVFRPVITNSLVLASNATLTVDPTNLAAANGRFTPTPGIIDLPDGKDLTVGVDVKGSATNAANVVSGWRLLIPNFPPAGTPKWTTTYVYATNSANGTNEGVTLAVIPGTNLLHATKAQLVNLQNTGTTNILTLTNLTAGTR